MRKYETVYVLRPDLDEAAIEGSMKKVADAITENGGTVDKTDAWGVRKLAYEISDYTEGNYVVVNFTGEPEIVKALDYVYKVSDVYLRSLVVREEE